MKYSQFITFHVGPLNASHYNLPGPGWYWDWTIRGDDAPDPDWKGPFDSEPEAAEDAWGVLRGPAEVWDTGERNQREAGIWDRGEE